MSCKVLLDRQVTGTISVRGGSCRPVVVSREVNATATPLFLRGPVGPTGAAAYGWAFYDSDLFTEAAPLEIDANTPTLLPIDSDGSATNVSNLQKPFDTHAFVNGSSKLQPLAVNDLYLLRILFRVRPLQTGGALTFWMDIGGGIGTIIEEAEALNGVSGSIEKKSITTEVFVGSTFIANGGLFGITTDVPVEVFDVDLLITPLYSGA